MKDMDYNLSVETTTEWDFSNISWDELNTSHYPFPNTLWNRKPAVEVALKTTLMLIIGIMGIFLNSVIIIIIVKNRWLWTANNMLLGNMALIDLLTLVFCPWFMLVREFYQNYVLRHFGCKFEGFMQASFMIACVLALLLVSYDRLAAAVLTSEAKVTKSAAPKLVFGSWIISVAVSIPWIVHRHFFERYWMDYVEMYCFENIDVLGIYWHFVVGMTVWAPLGVMFLTYGSILIKLEYGVRELTSRGVGQSVSKARKKAIKITGIVILAAVICRLPYTVFVFWRPHLNYQVNAVDDGYGTMLFVANVLMYFNSAINPLIYGFTNVRFKKAMDRTPGIACFKFGTWCCNLRGCERTEIVRELDKNTDKIYIIDSSPKDKKLRRMMKTILHINQGSMSISSPKLDESTKPTKVTPLNII